MCWPQRHDRSVAHFLKCGLRVILSHALNFRVSQRSHIVKLPSDHEKLGASDCSYDLQIFHDVSFLYGPKQNQPPRFPKVAGEFRTRGKTSAEAFSHPREGDLDIRHRLPDPFGPGGGVVSVNAHRLPRGSNAPARISPDGSH